MDVLAAVVAIVALIFALKMRRRMTDLELRIAEFTGIRPATPQTMPEARPAVPKPFITAEPVTTPTPARMEEAGPRTANTQAAPPAPPSPPAEPEAPAKSFEERFGASWVVWIGGIALALGGIFMVQYSIEAGLIGPGVRIFLGGLLATALVAAGEWTRRSEFSTGLANVPAAHIPSILTAAGITVAYATVYAAYALYGFLNPAVAFVLLGIVALATLAAALLHGPALAGLGLVGAYVTPLLVSTAEPNYWALYIYLAVVTGAAFALARMRMWLWLAITAVAFGFFWTLPGIHTTTVDALAPHLFHVMAGFALVAAVVVSGLLYGPDAKPGEIDPVSSGTLSAYLLGALLLTLATRHDPAALVVFTLMIVAILAISWRT